MSRWRSSTRSGSFTAARVISGVGVVFALIEVLFILMILFGANQANAFFKFVAQLATPLALFFPGLFEFENPNISIIVNYGLAAVFWLVVTAFVARLIAR
jgi:hypothetical protein